MIKEKSYDFFFCFINTVYHIDWLVEYESSLYTFSKSNLIMALIFLIYCWIQFDDFFENFYLYVHQRCWPVVFFACGFLDWGIRVIMALENEFRSVPSFPTFWKTLRVLILILWRFDRIHQWSCQVLDFYL